VVCPLCYQQAEKEVNTNSICSIFRQSGILKSVLSIGVAMTSLQAESKLTASSTNPGSIEIRLENDKPIAGIQFVIRSSSNIVLREIHKSGRTSVGGWTVASNRLNDSTINVVILNDGTSYFANGSGVLAEVSISQSGGGLLEGKFAMTAVVAADPGANLVSITSSGTTLNSQSSSSDITSSDFSLGQNYPNPFNPSTRITFTVQKDAQVRLAVFDITGREVGRLVDQFQTKGTYSVAWNSSENRRGQLASGTYFARLQVGDKVVTCKMLLTK
jgi:hypothetical protein